MTSSESKRTKTTPSGAIADSRARRYSVGERRRGATIVEMAVVMPVFFMFMAAVVEFGHAFMVKNTLDAAARRAARLGSVDGVTNADVTAKANELLSAAFNERQATVIVKDASIFDSSSVDPSAINYSGLPNIALESAEPRQLFVVHIELDYNDVALFPPLWAYGLTLEARSVMRHE